MYIYIYINNIISKMHTNYHHHYYLYLHIFIHNIEMVLKVNIKYVYNLQWIEWIINLI